jgi:hypothetical protein
MSPKSAYVRACPLSDVAGLVGERVDGWIRSYSSEATSSALKDGVIIKGRPVDWVWAIPGTVDYLVVEFSDSHKQYVARTELPELVTPAIRPAVRPAIRPAITPVVTPTVTPAKAAEELWDETDEPLGATHEPIPDLAFLADVARERVYAWIRSCPLSATSSTLRDGSRVAGRPVGWAWAIPGTVEYLVVEFSDGHKQYLSPVELPELH